MTMNQQPAHRQTWSGLASKDPGGAIGVFGVAYDGASSFRRGSSEAPGRIRSLTPHVAPATETGLSLAGLRIRDYGDVRFEDHALPSPEELWQAVSAKVMEQAIRALDHRFTLVLGGDHAITIPTAAAAAQEIGGKMGLLHIDAHLDLMHSFEGRTWSHACTARRVLELDAMAECRAAFVGIRSWLNEEVCFVTAHPEIAVHTARSVYSRGIAQIAEDVCRQLESVDSLYVTLDIDALDPAYAPGTGTPEPGGMSTREVLELLRVIFERLPVRVLDIVEVSPPLDHADITSFAAIKVAYEAFGWIHQANVS